MVEHSRGAISDDLAVRKFAEKGSPVDKGIAGKNDIGREAAIAHGG